MLDLHALLCSPLEVLLHLHDPLQEENPSSKLVSGCGSHVVWLPSQLMSVTIASDCSHVHHATSRRMCSCTVEHSAHWKDVPACHMQDCNTPFTTTACWACTLTEVSHLHDGHHGLQSTLLLPVAVTWQHNICLAACLAPTLGSH